MLTRLIAPHCLTLAPETRRHGVFIEEAISHNIVFGNQLNANHQAGVHVWNEEVVGNTGPNLIAATNATGTGGG